MNYERQRPPELSFRQTVAEQQFRPVTGNTIASVINTIELANMNPITQKSMEDGAFPSIGGWLFGIDRDGDADNPLYDLTTYPQLKVARPGLSPLRYTMEVTITPDGSLHISPPERDHFNDYRRPTVEEQKETEPAQNQFAKDVLERFGFDTNDDQQVENLTSGGVSRMLSEDEMTHVASYMEKLVISHHNQVKQRANLDDQIDTVQDFLANIHPSLPEQEEHDELIELMRQAVTKMTKIRQVTHSGRINNGTDIGVDSMVSTADDGREIIEIMVRDDPNQQIDQKVKLTIETPQQEENYPIIIRTLRSTRVYLEESFFPEDSFEIRLVEHNGVNVPIVFFRQRTASGEINSFPVNSVQHLKQLNEIFDRVISNAESEDNSHINEAFVHARNLHERAQQNGEEAYQRQYNGEYVLNESTRLLATVFAPAGVNLSHDTDMTFTTNAISLGYRSGEAFQPTLTIYVDEDGIDPTVKFTLPRDHLGYMKFLDTIFGPVEALPEEFGAFPDMPSADRLDAEMSANLEDVKRQSERASLGQNVLSEEQLRNIKNFLSARRHSDLDLDLRYDPRGLPQTQDAVHDFKRFVATIATHSVMEYSSFETPQGIATVCTEKDQAGNPLSVDFTLEKVLASSPSGIDEVQNEHWRFNYGQKPLYQIKTRFRIPDHRIDFQADQLDPDVEIAFAANAEAAKASLASDTTSPDDDIHQADIQRGLGLMFSLFFA